MTFKIQGIPPSYNKHFNINYQFKEVYLTQEARDFKRTVKACTPVMLNLSSDTKLRLAIEYNHDWYFKNGKILKCDIQNLDKLLIDALADKLGIDDSQFFEIHLFKVQNVKESYTLVNVELLPV